MTRRSIEEIDRELNDLSERQSELVDNSLYYDGRFWRWRDCSVISEINRIRRRMHRLYAERNQACFRDWTKHIEEHSIL